MVNLLGPGAFGCARPAIARPPFDPLNAPGDQDDWFKDCTSELARDGTEWRAAPLNAILAVLRAAIRKSGVAVSNLDDDLLARAIRSQGLNFTTASGTANALTLTLNSPIASYAAAAGMPIRFVAAHSNTGAATVSIDGLGHIPIVRPLGQPVQQGDMIGGRIVDAILTGTVLQLTGLTQNLTAGYFGWATAGSYTWTVPAGVYWIALEVAGGGGGGAGANGNLVFAGGGGGASGVALSVLPVTPGDVLTVTVGAGGVAGVAAHSPTPGITAGGNGGSSTVNNPGKWTVTCGGGFGAADHTPGSGNSGTGAGFGGYGLSGGYGDAGFALVSGAGSPPFAYGGMGGANYFGGGGASLYLNHASGGRAPGTGGGGGMIYPGTSIHNGGAGLAGIVNIRF